MAKLGNKLHCFDHCLEFIKAEPDERLRQVMKHGDRTICLIRDHNTDSHMARAAREPEKLQTCGLYDKVSETHCTSIQNTSFHSSANHEAARHNLLSMQEHFHKTQGHCETLEKLV